jgi:hypothetical protein
MLLFAKLPRFFCIIASVLFALNISHAKVPPAEVTAIESQVSNFYTWYLPLILKNGDPLRQNRETLSTYSAKALLDEIDALIAKDDLDADYFTQAQDFLENWPKRVAVTATKVSSNTATTRVALGTSAKQKQHLAVSLIKEANVWKIRKVKRVSR